MRVARLEVFGFKSFMNRLLLPLEGGISGVVGPNGCGKSNIVDALRWVLGETRASNLRGELLEDVIFNGTDKFRPLGLAEVSITLRSRGDNFFADLLTPLEVLRLEDEAGLNRSEPESEAGSYPPNDSPTDSSLETGDENSEKHKARPDGFNAIGLKVIDGFKGRELKKNETGAGQQSQKLSVEKLSVEKLSAETLSVEKLTVEKLSVETQNTDFLATGKPGAIDRTGENETDLDDDVADQASDSQTPAAALAPGLLAPGLLNRFAWLKATSEVQITRRLYRSGESEFFLNLVPCKIKDIKDLLRAVGLGPRSYTIVAQGEVGRIVSARPEERRAIIEEAAGVLGIKERIAAAKRRLDETRANLTRLDDLISEITRQVSSLKRQATRAEARAQIKDRLMHLDRILLVERLAAFDAHLKQLQTTVAALQVKEQALISQVTTRRVEEETTRTQLAAIEAQGDALRLEVDGIKEELHRRTRLMFEQESRANELRNAVTMKREEAVTNQDRAEGLKVRSTQLELERAEAQKEFDSVSAEAASLERGNDDELRAANTALQSARDTLRSVEGKSRSARENFLRSQTRLSEVERHIVASSPLTQIQRTLGERSPLTEALKRTSRPLSDALHVPAHLTTAVRAVLGEKAGFLVAKDPFEVARIAAQGESATKRNGFCLGVMRSGEIPTHEFSTNDDNLAVTGGEQPKVVSLLAALRVEAWGERAAHELLGSVLVAESAQDATAFFTAAHDEQGRPIRRPETVVTRAGEMFTADSFFIFNHEGGVLELKVRFEELKASIVGLESEASRVGAERDAAALAVEAAELRNREALAESQARQAAVRALGNRQGNARGRLDATDRMLRQTVSDAERAESAVRACAAKIADCEQAQAVVVAKISEMKSADTTGMEQRLAELTGAYKALDGQRSKLRGAVSSAANVSAELQRNLEFARREISRTELEQQKSALERQHSVESFIQLYGQETRNLATLKEATSESRTSADSSGAQAVPKALEPQTLLEYEQESSGLRARMLREGDVDPTTIEQYKSENERLQELLRQHADLSSAVQTLAETVLSLEQASVERFVKTFTAVARHFELLIPRLFGGGRGELVLTSPLTPLQSGVEITVRPPGKKPKSIELLSGGEKALCATAMIFAMFLVRPSPLCVLDEVDAPLDDANLVRLLTLIKEMSHKTQFLMITHNKQSMTMADNLVGVTMQEPGSTQILTVSLQEAFAHVS